MSERATLGLEAECAAPDAWGEGIFFPPAKLPETLYGTTG